MMTSATDRPRAGLSRPGARFQPMSRETSSKPDARHRAARRTALIFGAVALAFYVVFMLRMTVWK